MQNEVKIISNFGKLGNWVGGARVASTAESFEEVYTPYTGQVIAHVPVGNAKDVDIAVSAAKEAFPAWRDTHVKERVQVMFRLKRILEENN